MDSKSDNSFSPAQLSVIKNIWLNYYNNVLLEKGLITAEEYRKMKLKINIKYPVKRP